MKKRWVAIGILFVMLASYYMPAGQAELITPIDSSGVEYLIPPGAMVYYIDETLVWDYWLDDVETSLMLFLDSNAKMISDSGYKKRFEISSSKYPNTAFELRLYRMEGLKGQTLMDLSEDQIWDLINHLWIDNSEIIAHTDVFSLMEDVYFLRTRIAVEDRYTDWLLSLYDGWFIAMSATPDAPNEVMTQDEASFQNTLVASLFIGSNFPHYTEFALPDSAFSIADPYGKRHLVLDYDEENFKTLMLLSPDGRTVAINMSFIKNPLFEGQTLESLSTEGKRELYRHIDYFGKGVTNVTFFEENMQPMLYDSGVYMHYSVPDNHIKAALTLKDSWAMVAHTSIYEEGDDEYERWCMEAMDSIARRFMGEDISIPHWEATPLEPTFAKLYIEDTHFVFHYPSNATIIPVEDENKGQVIPMLDPDYAAAYALFTILAPDLRDLDLLSLSDEERYELCTRITSMPDAVSMIEAKPLYEGGPAVLRLMENRDGHGYSEHLLCFYGNWLINMMIQRIDGFDGITPQERAYQERLLRWNMDNNQTYGRRFTLEGTDFSFSLPEGMLYEAVMSNDYITMLNIYPIQSSLTCLTLVLASHDSSLESEEEVLQTPYALWIFNLLSTKMDLVMEDPTFYTQNQHSVMRYITPETSQQPVDLLMTANHQWLLGILRPIAGELVEADAGYDGMTLALREAILRRFLGEDVALPVVHVSD